jgi:hypothetical protein
VRLRLLLLVPAVAITGLGAEGLYHALRGRDVVSLECQSLTNAKPSAHRLRVTGCEIDYAGVGFRGGETIEELFLPARPVGRAVPAPIVIVTRNPAALALAQTVLGAGRHVPADRSLPLLHKAVTVAGADRAIDGLVRAGLLERLRARRIISGLTATPVAANALLVDLEASPDFLRPLMALAGGLLVFALAFVLLRPAPTPPPKPRLARDPNAFNPFAVPEIPPAAPRMSSVVLPRLLLLNLPVDAGPETVETAPALGTRDEVIEILSGIVPDLVVDADRRGLSRPDHSLRIDVGRASLVATAVVESRGEAGAALVKEILLMTGWRAFAPKTGLFVSGDELTVMAALAKSTGDRGAEPPG